MIRYILANWKSYKNRSEAEEWIETFLGAHNESSRIKIILAPPFVYLESLYKKIHNSGFNNLYLAVQDISPFPPGAYTGAVAADMIKGLAEYAITGHAERRRYFHETNQEIANKVRESVDAGIGPILCVDRDYARAQTAALDESDLDKLIIGYGPAGSIGLDVPQDLGEAREAVKELQRITPSNPILYGGSIRKNNAADYIGIEGVSGLMVSSGCLDPEEFAAICRIAAET